MSHPTLGYDYEGAGGGVMEHLKLSVDYYGDACEGQ